MRLASNPRLARRLSHALYRDGRTLHECPTDSRHFQMLGRYYVMQRREVVRTHVDIEQLARELGVWEDPPPPPPLPEFIDMKALIGTRRITERQAELNRKRMVQPMKPRPGTRGLVRLTVKALWAAIEASTFPAPVRGPKGLVWRSADVLRWKSTNQ